MLNVFILQFSYGTKIILKQIVKNTFFKAKLIQEVASTNIYSGAVYRQDWFDCGAFSTQIQFFLEIV